MTREMRNPPDLALGQEWLTRALGAHESIGDAPRLAPQDLAGTVAELPEDVLAALLSRTEPPEQAALVRRLAQVGVTASATPTAPARHAARQGYVEEEALAPLGRALRSRVPWLLLNLLTAFLAAAVVAPFGGTISRIASLAVFMPVIAGHGGNTGTQVATIVVRSLGTGNLRANDVRTVLRKEAAFGIVHGLLAGMLTAAYALLLNQNLWLAAVVVVAMVGNVFAAGLAGSVIPLALRRAGQDPALASSIWLTTFTDMFGFVLLLELGTLLVTKLD